MNDSDFPATSEWHDDESEGVESSTPPSQMEDMVVQARRRFDELQARLETTGDLSLVAEIERLRKVLDNGESNPGIRREFSLAEPIKESNPLIKKIEAIDPRSLLGPMSASKRQAAIQGATIMRDFIVKLVEINNR